MKNHHGKSWQSAELSQLGKATDAAIARRIGRTRKAVETKRLLLGIPPKTPRRRKWTAHEVNLLGTMSDAALAERLGIWGRTVMIERQRRGVGAFAAKHRRKSI